MRVALAGIFAAPTQKARKPTNLMADTQFHAVVIEVLGAAAYYLSLKAL